MAATYCTPDDVRDNTNDSALSALTDDQLTAKIEEAEIYIDSHAGYWQKYDEVTPQSRIFPRVQDVDNSGDTFIPTAIKYATIAQVEFMYVNTPDRDHGVEEDEKPTKEAISPRSKKLMRGYTKRVGRINFPELQTPGVI